MPVVTGQLKSYAITGKPRDLSDTLNRVFPKDTPFYSMIGTGEEATQTLHEWTEETINDPKDNAQIEGFDVSDFEENIAAELSNRTQIFSKAISVSRSAQGVKQAGVSKQYAHQMANRMLEIKKDTEYALIGNSIDVAGSGSTARRMRGLAAWMKTNVSLGAGGAVATPTAPAVAGTLRPLTHDMIADMMQAAYEQGGNPSTLMSAPAVRRQVTKVLKAINEQDEDAKSKKATDTIKFYDGDFGDLTIINNRVQAKVPYAQNSLFGIDEQYWKKSFLTNGNWKEEELAKTGDSKKGFIVGELTLEAKAEKSSFMIADIDPTL